MSNKKRWQERLDYDPDDPAKQHAPKTSKNLMSDFLANKTKQGISLTSQAYVKWCEIAGRSAISHTMAVWVNDKTSNNYPELIVYIDTNTLITDFTTNAELYMERLAYVGFPVSKLSFKLSNKTNKNKHKPNDKKSDTCDVLPELNKEELQEIKKMCETLPSELKRSVSNAMELSLRRQKLENTQKK